MSQTSAIAIVGLLGALVLVGSGVWRRRRNPATPRFALMWAAIFALLFAIALWWDHSTGV